MTKTYAINEIFYSLQGEGARAGEASVFVRFAGCNLTCKVETHGFDCDTEFTGGRKLLAESVLAEAEIMLRGAPRTWVVFTGGEPLLQLDAALVRLFKAAGFKIALETNGSCAVADDMKGTIDWLVCSPKVAEHALQIEDADELRYVRHAGQALPRPRIKARAHFLSPAWTPIGLDRDSLSWCIQLCREHPSWRLSLQQHKIWGVR